MASLNAARENGLLVAIRAGGHNVAGYRVCDEGLMLDLSLMNAVRLDPQLDRVYVEGGATWATSSCDHAVRPSDAWRADFGNGGSRPRTIGRHRMVAWNAGLCIDNLIAADVVTADGRLSGPVTVKIATCCGR